MKSRQKGWLGLVLAAVMVFTVVLSGCSKNGQKETEVSPAVTSAGTVTPELTDKPEVKKAISEVTLYFPGDAPVGWNEVLAKVNQKLDKDNIGVSLKINWYSWGEYGDVVLLKSTAGEDFDGFLDAPWLHITKMITDGQILALDDYIKNYPNLQKSIPADMWESNKFFGKIYGIPHGITQGNLKGFMIRKDLREKYGLPEIKTLDDVLAFLYKVKENEKDMTPYGYKVDGVDMDRFNPTFWKDQPGAKVPVIGLPISVDVTDSNNPKVLNQLDSKVYDPIQLENFKLIRKLYVDGIFEKGVMQQTDQDNLFLQGKYAAIGIMTDGVASTKFSTITKNVPGAVMEAVFPYADENPKPYSDFKQANYLVVNKNSKNPEKVIALADWLSIKENHDLVQYGVEGVNWSAIGDDQYENVEGNQYIFPGYVLTWRPSLDRTLANMLPGDKKWYDYSKDTANFTYSPLANFTYDDTPFKTEVTKINAVAPALSSPLVAGLVDVEAQMTKLNEALAKAGSAKLADELQKQIDAWVKNKK